VQVRPAVTDTGVSRSTMAFSSTRLSDFSRPGPHR
jgi:hypothetical protein